MLSIEPNIVVCPSSFKRIPPGHRKCPLKTVSKGGLEIFFLLIECYRLSPILSFAPLFFNRLPPGHRKCPLRTVLKGKEGLEIFFLLIERYRLSSILLFAPYFFGSYPRKVFLWGVRGVFFS